jgi:SAM-dependent methyltransferase
VLEVGCNAGANLQWIVSRCDVTVGVDVSSHALDALHRAVPRAVGVIAEARSLPFTDGSFDLAFTSGVLIHQPESSVSDVIRELVRVSSMYVLSMEYAGSETEEIPYRGERGALFKRNYEALYAQLFPELRLVGSGFLTVADGWDDVTWWLFQKPHANESRS